MTDTLHDLIHPGEVLLEEFLEPLGISQDALSKAIHVPPQRIHEMVQGKRSITADTGLRLSRAFGMSDSFWVGLQTDYDTNVVLDLHEDQINAIKPLVA